MDTVCTSSSCLPFSMNVHVVMQLLISVFFAILFLQSGLDKITDRKGNLEWLTGHFSKSPVKNMVPFLLTLVTLLELATGVLSLAGIAALLVKKCDYWMFWGNLLAAKTLLFLFLGQRMAKDYAGAQSLVGYFIVSLIGLYLCGCC